MAKAPESPAAAAGWIRVRIAASILAAVNIGIFSLEIWKTRADKARVADLMRQLGAQAWPYPAYDPDYPFGYVSLPDGGFALYQTTPDYLPVGLTFILLLSCLVSMGGLVRRPGRLRALWPVMLFTAVAAPVVLFIAGTQIELPDLFEGGASPSARTVTSAAGVVTGLCQPEIDIGASGGSKGGSLYDVQIGAGGHDSTDLAAFPERVTAAAFASLVAAQARQAGCAPVRVVDDE